MAISTLHSVSSKRSVSSAALCSILTLVLTAFLAVFSLSFSVNGLADDDTNPTGAPLSLDRWKDWVLYEQPELNCPVMFDSDNRACQWLGELQLDANNAGASFKQSIQAFAETRFTLPGSNQHWPTKITVNGTTVPVVANESGHPEILLSAGEHELAGQFQWSSAPQSLTLNPLTGLVALRWNGQAISNPQRQQHRLSLGKPVQQNTSEQPQDKLDLSVVRLVSDGHPLLVETLLIADVAGYQREVVVGQPLLDGLIPLFVDSGGLPAQIDNQGNLRVQVRPGRWEITVIARSENLPTQLTRLTQSNPWPSEEVWAYADSPQHRLSKIDGVRQIDPRQSKLPRNWQTWPAYLVNADDVFTIDVVQANTAASKPDQLTLDRSIWLDFDGKGYSLRDHLKGQLQNTWRLEMNTPLALESAAINTQAQFITSINNGESSGVEVRQGNLDLRADLRLNANDRTLPANGWSVDFQTVRAVLNTPPGWRLITVTGADNIPGAWLSGWTVYRVFLLLITVLAIGKLWGWMWSLISLLAFIPLWLEAHILAYVILPVLICTALVRLLPKRGALKNWVQLARLMSLLVLTLAIVPFMIHEARNSIFPQLERGRTVFTPAQQSDSRLQERAVQKQLDAELYSSSESSRDKGLVKSAPVSTKINTDVDPNLVAQTGQGLPDWSWTSTPLTWNGPVLRDQQIKLIMLSPAQVFLIRFAALALLALLLWRFLDIGKGRNGKWLIAPAVMAAVSGNAQADYPQDQMLNELQARLRATAVAAPRASIDSMDIVLTDRTLTAQLEVHALSDTAIPLPLDYQNLTPVKVSHIDASGSTDALLFTNDDSRLWVLVDKGVHRLDMQVLLKNVDQFQLPLALRPHKVTVESDDWTVRGIERNGVPTSQLNFVRIETKVESTTDIKPSVLPPFFKVDRLLSLGLKWQVQTTVQRQDRSGRAESISIPLLPNETVITEGIEIDNGTALLSFGPNSQSVQWQSLLETESPIQLQAAPIANALEVWRVDVGTMWHVDIDGTTPIYQQGGGNAWQPSWHTWPGDNITIDVTRPSGIAGPSLSIEKSTLVWRPSTRVTEGVLTMSIRSSRGTQHQVALPEGAQLQSVEINGRAQPIVSQDNNVTLPIQPGKQQASIQWRQAHPISNVWTTPAPMLGTDHVNANLTVEMPSDRWVFWMDGPRLGPAVVIWGLLIIMLFLAAALGEASKGRVPAGALSWLFIGLGLSQTSILTLLPIAAWLFLFYLRSTMHPGSTSRHIFNATQIGIAAMTFIALLILLEAVQTGLLGYPQMQISGNGSSSHLFHWYQDRYNANYPRARIYSVPLYFYRGVMLLWALWLAYTLIKWLQWGWNAFSQDGLWSTIPKKPKTTGRLKAQLNDTNE